MGRAKRRDKKLGIGKDKVWKCTEERKTLNMIKSQTKYVWLLIIYKYPKKITNPCHSELIPIDKTIQYAQKSDSARKKNMVKYMNFVQKVSKTTIFYYNNNVFKNLKRRNDL